ncbi:MAG: hypothetical protein LUD01_05990 [Clostridiales bacterium]|nr:hypothetical protein [Clostridiales bacterium]
MKKKLVKKLSAALLAGCLAVGTLAGCGSTSSSDSQEGAQTSADEEQGTETTASTDGGTIMWLANISAGAQYDAYVAYAEEICAELGYEFQVVYGDSNNDPAENLSAVKNAMTDDVVGLICSQDGGIQNIMEEYPELYVVGCSTDMESVYGEGGTSADCASNEKFLGTIADGHVDGETIGEVWSEYVIEKGYKKIATMIFPSYAYPGYAEGETVFREKIEEYNATVSEDEQIEIVGDVKVLEFATLEESWFLEDGNGDLDAIIGFMDAVDFIYPTLKSAIANGNCSETTQVFGGGYSDDESVQADVGEDGNIGAIIISPIEDIAWSIAMLDNAITGNMYSDYTASERIDSIDYVIDSAEDMTNVAEKSLIGTADAANAQITMEDLETVLTRYNADATYEDLKALFASDQLTCDALAE